MEKQPAAVSGAGAIPAAPAPAPTTYVQTDAATFKELVQRLTGPHEEPPSSSSSAPATDGSGGAASPTTSSQKLTGVRRPAFKLLHERRQAYRSKMAVLKPLVSPRQAPEDLGFTIAAGSAGRSPLPSPSTQLSALAISDGGEGETIPVLNKEEEEKAIRERRFYLHPSPRSAPRSAAPELLPLFPLTSPTAK